MGSVPVVRQDEQIPIPLVLFLDKSGLLHAQQTRIVEGVELHMRGVWEGKAMFDSGNCFCPQIDQLDLILLDVQDYNLARVEHCESIYRLVVMLLP